MNTQFDTNFIIDNTRTAVLFFVIIHPHFQYTFKAVLFALCIYAYMLQ